MTCREYVESKLTKKAYNKLQTDYINHNYTRNLQLGEKVVFVTKGHIGFATVTDYHSLTTDECSNGKIFSRVISLFNDNYYFIKL